MLLPLTRRLRQHIHSALAVVFWFGEREAGRAAAEKRLEVASEVVVDRVERLAEPFAHDVPQFVERLLKRRFGLLQIGNLRRKKLVSLLRLSVVDLGLCVDRSEVANPCAERA